MPSRRTTLVLDAVYALAAAGNPAFAPAAVGARLRSDQSPMSAWEIRGELSSLEASGELRLDPATALWSLRVAPTVTDTKAEASATTNATTIATTTATTTATTMASATAVKTGAV